jgi:hypothetical protein
LIWPDLIEREAHPIRSKQYTGVDQTHASALLNRGEDMEKHITIIGALYIAFGLLGLLGAVIVFLVFAGGGILSGEAESMIFATGFGSILAFFVILISVPGLIGGFGLLKRRPWARILVIILGCLNLLNLPLGTALGIYTLWALTKPETQRLFLAGAHY